MWLLFLRITEGSVSVRVQRKMRSNNEPKSAIYTTEAKGVFNDQRLQYKSCFAFSNMKTGQG